MDNKEFVEEKDFLEYINKTDEKPGITDEKRRIRKILNYGLVTTFLLHFILLLILGIDSRTSVRTWNEFFAIPLPLIIGSLILIIPIFVFYVYMRNIKKRNLYLLIFTLLPVVLFRIYSVTIMVSSRNDPQIMIGVFVVLFYEIVLSLLMGFIYFVGSKFLKTEPI